MAFMALQGHWLFFLQHTVFFVLAIDGTWNWLVAPRLLNINQPPPGDRL
jgi:hypothetical protein